MALSKVNPNFVNGSQGGGNKNLIINGAMRIAQRATSSSAIGFQTVDRFRIGTNATDELVMTQAQVSDSPNGFSNSFKVTITTPEAAFTTTEWFYTRYTVEAQDAQQLAYGTSSAKKTTLSFYVKSSVTGNYAVLNFNGTSTRSQTLTYTINAANTWERKTITFDGDTTGSYPNSNAAGPDLYFTLSAGPDSRSSDGTSWGAYASAKAAFGQTANVGSTNGATWQITGVQLEVGDTATDFEHRTFQDDLLLCQRYCHVIGDTQYQSLGVGTMYNATNSMFYVHTPVPMRSTPSATKTVDGSSVWLQSYVGASGLNSNPTPQMGEQSPNGRQNNFRIYVPGANNSTTAGYSTWNQVMPNATFILASEL